MKIAYRRQLGIMERAECEALNCTMPAGYAYDEAGARTNVCVRHDLEVREDIMSQRDLVLDMHYGHDRAFTRRA